MPNYTLYGKGNPAKALYRHWAKTLGALPSWHIKDRGQLGPESTAATISTAGRRYALPFGHHTYLSWGMADGDDGNIILLHSSTGRMLMALRENGDFFISPSTAYDRGKLEHSTFLAYQYPSRYPGYVLVVSTAHGYSNTPINDYENPVPYVEERIANSPFWTHSNEMPRWFRLAKNPDSRSQSKWIMRPVQRAGYTNPLNVPLFGKNNTAWTNMVERREKRYERLRRKANPAPAKQGREPKQSSHEQIAATASLLTVVETRKVMRLDIEKHRRNTTTTRRTA